jgi:hypothetical protein
MNKIIQHYLETNGLKTTDIKDKKIIVKNQKQPTIQEKEIKSDNFLQIENTCDRIINNIDKLLDYIKNE